jgi:hypothetical protein
MLLMLLNCNTLSTHHLPLQTPKQSAIWIDEDFHFRPHDSAKNDDNDDDGDKDDSILINKNKNKLGDFYSAYPSPSGRLKALRAECVTRVTRQTGKLNEERSRTTTSRSQQQIWTERKFTATAVIRTRDHRVTTRPSPP